MKKQSTNNGIIKSLFILSFLGLSFFPTELFAQKHEVLINGKITKIRNTADPNDNTCTALSTIKTVGLTIPNKDSIKINVMLIQHHHPVGEKIFYSVKDLNSFDMGSWIKLNYDKSKATPTDRIFIEVQEGKGLFYNVYFCK